MMMSQITMSGLDFGESCDQLVAAGHRKDFKVGVGKCQLDDLLDRQTVVG